MSKFKIGDRVRRTTRDNAGCGPTLKVGTVAEVASVDEGGWLTIAGYEKLRGNDPECFTLAPKFAVGDKVRFTADNRDGGEKYGAKGDVASIIHIYDDGRHDVRIRLVDGLPGEWRAYVDQIELIPTTLTSCAAAEVDNLADEYGGGKPRIVAGRYYKTRDGRKVGPMVDWRSGYIEKVGDARIWKADGESYGKDSDLIAEWSAVAPLQPTTMADIVRKHSGTSIVCLIENGQPKPSTEPFVHADASAASTEASRLAGIHKGQEFGVYSCVDVKKVDAPAKVYDFEWQRKAASGLKIEAIKELRSITGLISLRSAKQAVEDFVEREAD